MKVLSLRKLLCTLSFCCALALTSIGQDKDWRPVPPEDLKSTTAVVDPTADAEAIFWEVRVDDSSVEELALKHYVRVKIFTERGREQFSKHDVVFTKGTKVKDVEARVTKPDGTTVLLKKEDVMERDIVRASGVKVRAKTFAMPGIEIGSIVEYRYKEVVDGVEANMRLIFQREVPIRNITYYVRPFSGQRAMLYEPFNTDARFEKDKNGFHRISMTNVPAFVEETNMIPDDEARSWIYIYYHTGEKKIGDPYWREFGKIFYDLSKDSMKANDEVKKITGEVIAGATTDDEKLQKIYDYAKANVRNLHYADKVSDEEWKKAYAAKSPSDTLKLRYGLGSSVDNLFGAMARAAGYDARPAFSGSRNEMTFNRNIANFRLMVNSSSVAVMVSGKWRFFSPAGYFTQYGMLSWAEEGQVALIADPKDVIWQELSLSPSDKSRETRVGRFKLLEDGTLEGDAEIRYTGHRASYVKAINRGDSPSEQENKLKSLIKSNIMGTTEVISSSIENMSDPDKPLVYKFKIRVPGFASRTGKRLFFQPNVFERSSKPRFTSSGRKHEIQFNYPFSEKDDIIIELPTGFALENADSPAPLQDKQGISSHQVFMGVSKDGKLLQYRRDFAFGNNGAIRFSSQSYPTIKLLFELFNKADVHQLTLREAPTAATKD